MKRGEIIFNTAEAKADVLDFLADRNITGVTVNVTPVKFDRDPVNGFIYSIAITPSAIADEGFAAQQQRMEALHAALHETSEGQPVSVLAPLQDHIRATCEAHAAVHTKIGVTRLAATPA